MIKIPLLLEVRPKSTAQGPTVFLGEGEWEISSNVVDSMLELIFRFTNTATGGALVEKMRVLGNQRVEVHIARPGTEKHISVYAEKVA